jgi:hypothetical protein
MFTDGVVASMKIYRGDGGSGPRSAGRDGPDHEVRSLEDSRTTVGLRSRPGPAWVTVRIATRGPVTGSTVTGDAVSVDEAGDAVSVDEAGDAVSIDEAGVVVSAGGRDPPVDDVVTNGTAPQEGSNT